MLGEEDDSHARRRPDRLSLDDGRVLPDRIQKPRRRDLRLHPIDVRMENREFVAAEPREDVRFAHRRLHSMGETGEKLVSDLVTEPVIDLFESVEVHPQEGTVPGVALGASQVPFENRIQLTAVVQAGQRVVGCEVQQLLLLPLQMRDVGQNPLVVDEVPLQVANRTRVENRLSERAVLALESQLAPLDAFLVAQAPIEDERAARRRVGVGQVGPSEIVLASQPSNLTSAGFTASTPPSSVHW